MEGKFERSGARCGKTHRSRFAQSRGNRSEGLLVHSSAVNCSSKGGGNVAEAVTYSLGKQNRWLIPEVIREIKPSSAGFEDPEDVVLVERYTNVNRGRADCISVFNSKTAATRKPKRKLAQAKDLLGDSEEMNSWYEVAYPHPSGSGLKSTKRPAGHLGKRKKNSCTRKILEDDFDDLGEIEYSDREEEEEFCDQLIVAEQQPRLDLDALIKSTTKASPKAHASEMSAPQHDPQSQLKGKHIFVESDPEMEQMHLEYLTQIKSGCSLLDVRDEIIKNNTILKRKQRKCKSKAPAPKARNQADETTNESVPQAETSPALPPEPVHQDDCEGVVVKLRRQDIKPEALAEQWMHMYKEAASYPRAFALNIAPLMTLSNNKEAFIVFSRIEDHERFSTNETKALINVVVSNDENDDEKTPTDFSCEMERRGAEQEIWTLEDIVNVAICSLEGHFNDAKVDYKEPRKPRLSLEVFTDLFGWKSKTFSSQAAKQQLKEHIARVNRMTVRSTCAVTESNGWLQRPLECEICFQEIMDKDCDDTASHLSLLACGHMFCNSCWRAHLRTQIEQGRTDLQCPGYECDSAVDDVTVMSLLPSLYGRHLTKRLDTSLEMNPVWKWCPADQCKLVVKATAEEGTSAARDVSSVQPVPVMCVCGTMWCFKCQEDAHWPATCEEARAFRKKNASYAQMVMTKKKELITSVGVKHCPSCNYPVEKGPGCNHMTCILCGNQYCWECLQTWGYPHKCKGRVGLQNVQLPKKFIHAASYQHVAVTSRVSRTSNVICRIHRKLDKIEAGLSIYTECFPLKQDLKKTSCTEKRLKFLCENEVTSHLKEVFNFKFQAHLVLEGLAISLSFSNGSAYSKRLAMEFSRLLFIVERINEMLQDLNRCLTKKECLLKLKSFINFGKECIHFIGRNTK